VVSIGGELECDIISRVFYARLTEWDRIGMGILGFNVPLDTV